MPGGGHRHRRAGSEHARVAFAAPIPAPGGMVLLFAGLRALGLAGRRRHAHCDLVLPARHPLDSGGRHDAAAVARPLHWGHAARARVAQPSNMRRKLISFSV